MNLQPYWSPGTLFRCDGYLFKEGVISQQLWLQVRLLNQNSQEKYGKNEQFSITFSFDNFIQVGKKIVYINSYLFTQLSKQITCM